MGEKLRIRKRTTAAWFIMSLFEGYYRKDSDRRQLRRTTLRATFAVATGYRPIRDAAEDALPCAAGRKCSTRQLKRAKAKPKRRNLHFGGEIFLRPLRWRNCSAPGEHSEARMIAGADRLGAGNHKAFPKRSHAHFGSKRSKPERN